MMLNPTLYLILICWIVWLYVRISDQRKQIRGLEYDYKSEKFRHHDLINSIEKVEVSYAPTLLEVHHMNNKKDELEDTIVEKLSKQIVESLNFSDYIEWTVNPPAKISDWKLIKASISVINPRRHAKSGVQL